MNQIDWQLVIVLLCVATAGLCILRRLVHFFKQRPGCAGGSCSGCPSSSQSSSAPNFISLDQLK
ncbi:Virus attachment protein p12 family protein [Gimesia chilikensis]|jgi:hypothetical protein|uniref:FeoB-associated Cys-rich membrane protein n=2 Tax=Gimesia TaxID=1649453 RepID=A0A6I6AL44_9PLAN|nr:MULTISPECIES: hypothetical protein [Gimesia]QDU04845.1 Virus attachment protein p12 family protein [Gimesia chilikensis]QGQ25269.1 hypothetical protein F1728_22400 [Gimesia benthica]